MDKMLIILIELLATGRYSFCPSTGIPVDISLLLEIL
jgi:hypothetical protein